MTIFVIVAPGESPELKQAIEHEFPKHFEFAPGQFVASETMTAAQVAQKLGVDGQLGQFVVFSVAGHWGYHKKELWEWLAANAS